MSWFVRCLFRFQNFDMQDSASALLSILNGIARSMPQDNVNNRKMRKYPRNCAFDKKWGDGMDAELLHLWEPENILCLNDNLIAKCFDRIELSEVSVLFLK